MLRFLIALSLGAAAQLMAPASAQVDWKPDTEKLLSWNEVDKVAMAFCLMSFAESPLLNVCVSLEQQVDAGVDINPAPNATARQKCDAMFENPSTPHSVACQLRALVADEDYKMKEEGQ